MTPDVLNEVRAMHGFPPGPVPVVDADPSDPATIRAQRRRARQVERERLATLAALMEHAQGRGWVHWLLTECRAFHGSDWANNPNAMARQVGQREIATMLLADLHRACPELYLTMLREQQGQTNERDDSHGATAD